MQQRRHSSLIRRRLFSVLLASACVGASGNQLHAQSPPPDSRSPGGPAAQTAPSEDSTQSELQPPMESTLEIRIARRPWLLEKLTKPKTEPSIKMNPPLPPAEIPDPPSMSRMAPKASVSDGWFRRRADGIYDQHEPGAPALGAKGGGEQPEERDVLNLKNGLRQGTSPSGQHENHPETSVDRSRPASKAQPPAKETSSESVGPEANTFEPGSQADDEVTVRQLRVNRDGTLVTESEQPAVDRDSSSRPGNTSEGASQYIGSDEDEPPLQLDYTGYPQTPIRLTHSVSRMRNSIRQCLQYYYSRPEVANERSNWGMLHAIMVYGADTKILAGNKSYSAVAWIAGNNACRGQRLLVEQNGRITARSGVGLQGHQGQMLAIFSLCDVPSEYPLYAGETRYTLRDLIESEMLACKSGEELTFTLIGLAHYLDTSAVWTSAEGETWDFERLLREELGQPIVGAACGGTHRLMGYAHALRKRRAEGRPITGQWKRAEVYTRDFVKYAYQLQNRDGSMTTDWFEGREDNNDIDRKIQTTGHIIEWLLTVTPDSQLQNPRLVNAVRYLLASMYNERDNDWKIGPKGHALRSLAMYYERVYQSGPAWSSRSMAQTPASPRR